MYTICRGIIIVMIIPHVAKYVFKIWMESTFTIEYFDGSIDKIELYMVIFLSMQLIIVSSLLFLMTLRFTRYIDEAPKFNDFCHFDFPKYWYSVSIVIGFALGCSYYFGMIALTGTPYGGLNWNDSQPPFYVILSLAFLYTIFPPITEELFFRGICYNVFRINLGLNIITSIFISSLLFTIWHPQVYNDHIVAIPILFISVIMCLLLEKVRSVVPLIFIHSTCNLVIWLLTHIL